MRGLISVRIAIQGLNKAVILKIIYESMKMSNLTLATYVARVLQQSVIGKDIYESMKVPNLTHATYVEGLSHKVMT